MAQRQSRTNDSRGDIRGSTGEEFCFWWKFNPNGCPNPQTCCYKHVCIHCSSDKHKGKSCTGAASPVRMDLAYEKQAPLEVNWNTAPSTSSSIDSTISPLEDCPLRFHAWNIELASDLDRAFILNGLRYGFKLIPESTHPASTTTNLTIIRVLHAQNSNQKWTFYSQRNFRPHFEGWL